MIYASVCSGVESATLAWEHLGWKPAWFSEIEPFPCAVLKHRYPDVPNLGDMTKIKGEDYAGKIDLLVGGTPCQDFSVAGKQAGLAGSRSCLANTFIELLNSMRPGWFVWENVPGALSTNRGRDFATLIQAFTESGYGVAWRVLDAQYVRTQRFPNAIPQRRRRLFVVGYFGDPTFAAKVLFERESVSGNPPPRIRTRENLATVARGNVSEANRIGNGQVDGECSETKEASQTQNCTPDPTAVCIVENVIGRTENNGGNGTGAQEELSYTLNAFGVHAVAFPLDLRNATRITDKGQGAGIGEQDGASFTLTSEGNVHGVAQCLGPAMQTVGVEVLPAQRVSNYKDPPIVCVHGSQNPIAHYEHANCVARNNGRENCIGFIEGSFASYNESDAAGTVRASGGAIGAGSETLSASRGGFVRRLTPIECERLMGFPDNYTLIPFRRGMSQDSLRYKACGNSMCVNVMEWIGQRIQTIEAQQTFGNLL